MVDNRYRVVRQIGQGGMGAVYEAVDLRLGGTFALKQMFLNPNAPPQQAAQVEKAFKREAQTLHHLCPQ
jgi:serine/threonine protein kinase